jgi:hypothetical protein
MPTWCRLFCGLLLVLVVPYPVRANHQPQTVARAYLGSTNREGPSAYAVDAARGLIFQTFLGSRAVVVARTSDLSILRSWELPAWEGETRAHLVALNGVGDRFAVLRTSATSADIVLFNTAGATLGSASFPYDGRSMQLVMAATTAFIVRQDAPLLAFDGTLRELGTAPQPGQATVALVGDAVAYFSRTSAEQVNLVLLDPATLAARTMEWSGPWAATYIIRWANGRIYLASCGGLSRIDIGSGAVLDTLDGATVGCLTDFVVSPDEAVAVAIPVTFSGSTALVYIDPQAWIVGRSVEVPGGSGRLVALWQQNKVFVTTLDYTTGQQSFAGVLDVATGSVRALPYGVAYVDTTYGIATGDTTLLRYDGRDDTWSAAAYGGAVTKVLRAADGTIFAQIGGAVARIPFGATAPDVFYPGGDDMVLDGSTLLSHDGGTVFVSDTTGTSSRALATLRYPPKPGMAYDAATRKLVLAYAYQPRNARTQVGITVVNTADGTTEDLLQQSSPSISIAHDPVNRRVYAVTGTFGADGAPASEGELRVTTLDTGTTTTIPMQGVALGSPQLVLAFDRARGVLAIGDGANITAIDGAGRQLWTIAAPHRALDVTGSQWVVGGDNALALLDPVTGRVGAPAQVGYSLTDVGVVNDLIYGFDRVSGATVSAQPAAVGLVFQIEGSTMPPTAWDATPTNLLVGDAGGVVVVSAPHGGAGRGNISTFYRRWERADAPVIGGAAQRSWTWGPRPWAVQVEPYAEATGGFRLVEYRDKTRMEITRPGVDTSAPWYVTNGLLVQEMLRGQVQTGDNRFEAAPCPLAPARSGCASTTPVAGDSENNADAPTYADMGGFVAPVDRRVGQRVSASLLRAEGAERRFVLGARPDLATPPTEIAQYDTTTQHNIPRVFWDYMNQRGPVVENGRIVEGQVVDALFAFGRPITEPYWTQSRVGGEIKDVLLQLFERRVLTYTPTNPAPFQVEMGNVGQHYYAWRYDERRW